MDARITYSSSGLHQICNSFTTKFTKSVRDQLFKHRIWRPGFKRNRKISSNPSQFWGAQHQISSRQGCLLHQTIQKHRLDLFVFTESWIKSDAPEAIELLQKGSLPFINIRAAMMIGEAEALSQFTEITLNASNLRLIQHPQLNTS